VWSYSRPDRFISRKNHQYPSHRKIFGSQSGLDAVGKRKFSCLSREKNPNSQAFQPMPYSVYRPSCPGRNYSLSIRNENMTGPQIIMLQRTAEGCRYNWLAASVRLGLGCTTCETLIRLLTFPALHTVRADHSGRPHGLRHEMSSPARTLGSWVRIPLKAWKFVCIYSLAVLSCVGSGLTSG
jgi:hypothetical protein